MHVRVLALSSSLVAAAACGGGSDTVKAPAPATPQQTEPLFKPIDPATAPPPPGQTPSSAPPPSAPLPGGGSEPVAMVTDLASGWPLNLGVGQTMMARLTADRAAGLRWSLRPGTDGGILTLAGDPGYESKPGEPAVEVFRLTATKPGKTTVAFDYKKGSDGTVLKSASYSVTVQ
jgi:predicted secreted protein